ncbi:hypothetical protein KKD61_00210, partial [Patescibacteria group bacterium]|nr:hypothetical protein [Patescibacteria group bacterium]
CEEPPATKQSKNEIASHSLAMTTSAKLEEEIKKAAQADAKVAGYLKNKKIIKTIYVPGRLINFVVR